MDISKVLESLPKYAQVLYNDCIVQLSKDEILNSSARKELIQTTISAIKRQLELIEQHINQ